MPEENTSLNVNIHHRHRNLRALSVALIVGIMVVGFYVEYWRSIAVSGISVYQVLLSPPQIANETLTLIGYCPPPTPGLAQSCAPQPMAVGASVGMVVWRYGFLPMTIEGYGNLANYHVLSFICITILAVTVFFMLRHAWIYEVIEIVH